MSIIKITLPLGELPVNGKQITFTAPCSSADTEALQIEGVNYTVVDALCNCVTGSGGRWQAGAVVSVILDTVNQYAYIQNGNYTADQVTVTAETASALGLNNGASVDNALAKLSGAVLEQYYYWKEYKTKPSAGLTNYKQRSIISGSSSETNPVEIQYSAEVTISGETVALKNPTTVTVTYTTMASQLDLLKNKYFIIPTTNNANENDRGMLCYTDQSCTRTHNSGYNAYVYIYCYEVVASESQTFQRYVKSEQMDAYPNGASGSFLYEFLGLPLEGAKIETGSYTGTGKSHSANPNTLTFSFAPKFVWIYGYTNGTSYYDINTGLSKKDCSIITATYTAGHGFTAESGQTGVAYGKISEDRRTISWYSAYGSGSSSNGSNYQLNMSNYTYYYLAIG